MPVAFPKSGTARDEVLRELEDCRRDDVDWRAGRTFGLVYNPGDEVMSLVRDAYVRFMTENALGPMTFPSLRRFEAEVVAMTADLLGSDEQVVGTMTSGGTESILMAVKSARDHARHLRGERGHDWQILVPLSAHPAFDKAAHYLGLDVVHIPLGKDLRADLAAAEALISERTILIAGSAPGYPHGIIDDIAGLAALAEARGIWFHTDACLGGLLLPFVKQLGYAVPAFDFSLPGVSSMSADLHKYGYAAKGASVVLYRNEELRKQQFFVQADWPGGVYATPALAGARTGGSVAAAWAVLRYLGRDGYVRLAETIMATTRKLIDGAGAIDGLEVLGDPPMSVFALGSDRLNVYALGDALTERGWHTERQHLPPSLHLMVSPAHAEVADAFLADLAAAAGSAGVLAAEDVSQMAAMYGMLGTMPDRSAATSLARDLLAVMFRA